MSIIARWKGRVRWLKTETYAVYLALKDSRVPWVTKALIIFVVAHTFSPIDLIPDFIPLIGYLDDLLITPIGIFLAIKLIPDEVLAECREKAKRVYVESAPTNQWAAVVVIMIWLFFALFLLALIFRLKLESLD
jgi:uncharacterized membrane protein YkvA (DUF1232 family)